MPPPARKNRHRANFARAAVEISCIMRRPSKACHQWLSPARRSSISFGRRGLVLSRFRHRRAGGRNQAEARYLLAAAAEAVLARDFLHLRAHLSHQPRYRSNALKISKSRVARRPYFSVNQHRQACAPLCHGFRPVAKTRRPSMLHGIIGAAPISRAAHCRHGDSAINQARAIKIEKDASLSAVNHQSLRHRYVLVHVKILSSFIRLLARRFLRRPSDSRGLATALIGFAVQASARNKRHRGAWLPAVPGLALFSRPRLGENVRCACFNVFYELRWRVKGIFARLTFWAGIYHWRFTGILRCGGGKRKLSYVALSFKYVGAA